MNKTSQSNFVRQPASQSNFVRQHRAQQEMVGFMIIVVIVMVAGLVFFLISVKQESVETDSGDLYNFIYSSLAYTTDCAPLVIPQYSSLSDLISECYEGRRCTNLNKPACEYLNQTLVRILDDFKRTRNDIRGYQLELLYNSTTELRNIISPIQQGNCSSGKIFKAEEKIRSQDTDLIVRFKICKS